MCGINDFEDGLVTGLGVGLCEGVGLGADEGEGGFGRVVADVVLDTAVVEAAAIPLEVERAAADVVLQENVVEASTKTINIEKAFLEVL